MAVLLASVLAAVALIIAPGELFYFDVTPKVAVLLAGVAVAVMWRPSARVPCWFTAFVALSFASLAISAAMSSNRALSVFGTNWRRFGLLEQGAMLLFAWLVAAHGAANVRTILRIIAFTGLVLSLYGIAQYFGWDPFLPAAAYHIGEGIWTIVRPPGTLGYVSYFANWLLMSAFLSFALMRMETDRRWRCLAGGSAALAIIAMLLTGTRGAMIGLAAGLLFAGLGITRRTLAILAIGVLAAVAFYFSPPGWNLRSRARWFREDPRGGARLRLWRDSVRMSRSHLVFGFGPEVFTASFPRYESEDLARAYPDFSHESPHNMFLDVLVAQGLVGFLPLIGLLLWRRHSRLPRPDSSGRVPGVETSLDAADTSVRATIIAGIVAQQFVVFILPTALLFYTTIALTAADEVEPPRPPRLFPAAIPLALALLYFAARFTIADHALALAQHSIERRDGVAAAAHYDNYDRRRLPGTSAALWYSRSLINLRLFPAALKAGLAATRESETPFDAWYSLSILYALENDAADTERALHQAIAASPNWFKPHWTLSRLLLLEGRMDDARTEAAIAVRLDGGKHAEVQNLALHR